MAFGRHLPAARSQAKVRIIPHLCPSHKRLLSLFATLLQPMQMPCIYEHVQL